MDMEELQAEMMNLAKQVYDLSKKYGGIHISSCCVGNCNLSWTTYIIEGQMHDADYIEKPELL